MQQTQNKIAYIFGSSGGIGRSISLLFANSGYDVINFYHDSKIDGGIKVDVCDMNSVKKAYEKAKKIAEPDVIINAFGVSKVGLLQDADYYDEIFDVNMRGVYNVCKTAIPDFIAKKDGHIINISSVWGICGASCEVLYSAAKSAVLGFTKSLAKELAPSGIAVNAIAPGAVDTKMLNIYDKKELEKEIPYGGIIKPKEIAKTALFLAESNHITGQIISPNGGMCI